MEDEINKMLTWIWRLIIALMLFFLCVRSVYSQPSSIPEWVKSSELGRSEYSSSIYECAEVHVMMGDGDIDYLDGKGIVAFIGQSQFAIYDSAYGDKPIYKLYFEKLYRKESYNNDYLGCTDGLFYEHESYKKYRVQVCDFGLYKMILIYLTRDFNTWIRFYFFPYRE